MCCFSRSVRFVGSTKIFARGLPDGRQALVYAMNVELEHELAMILPLPVPPGTGDDAVDFVNLEGEERLFDQLEAAFPDMTFGFQPAARALGPQPQSAKKLEVFDVGRYEASFVPSAGDFARLDERFRLPAGFLAALPAYADFGFAVFRLKPERGLLGTVKRQSVQPMALSFPRREPRALFFPTVHVHDGKVSPQATFDHALYCQADGLLEATLGWTRSKAALGQFVPGARSLSLVDAARGGFAQALWGELRNADVWLREPKGVELSDLSGAGECHSFKINATAAYAIGWEGTERAAWSESASLRLAELCRGVRAGLAELEMSRRAAWRLGLLSAELPAHFMNGSQLWTGTSYMDGTRVQVGGGPARIRFAPFGKRVEPQQVTLGFAQLPDQEEAAAINAELARLLERVLP